MVSLYRGSTLLHFRLQIIPPFVKSNAPWVFNSNYTGHGCSKLATLLVKVLLNFQKLIPQICQYFLLKICEKFLQSSFVKFSKVNSSNMPIFFVENM